MLTSIAADPTVPLLVRPRSNIQQITIGAAVSSRFRRAFPGSRSPPYSQVHLEGILVNARAAAPCSCRCCIAMHIVALRSRRARQSVPTKASSPCCTLWARLGVLCLHSLESAPVRLAQAAGECKRDARRPPLADSYLCLFGPCSRDSQSRFGGLVCAHNRSQTGLARQPHGELSERKSWSKLRRSAGTPSARELHSRSLSLAHHSPSSPPPPHHRATLDHERRQHRQAQSQQLR